MKNEIASPSSVPSSSRNTPSGLSHGPQTTPQTVLPSRSFNVKFCWAFRPDATHRPSSRAIFGAGSDFTVAIRVRSSPTCRSVIGDVDGVLPPTMENDTCPGLVVVPETMRTTVDGSSQGPHATPTKRSPCILKTNVRAELPAPAVQVSSPYSA